MSLSLSGNIVIFCCWPGNWLPMENQVFTLNAKDMEVQRDLLVRRYGAIIDEGESG